MTNDFALRYFAVIDVETNWHNQVMSVGLVISDSVEFGVVDQRYYVIRPECEIGGMYSDRLQLVDAQLITVCLRNAAVEEMESLFTHYGVKDIFAYNAPFDRNCMTELYEYSWHDILPIAANRNTNDKLPCECEYFSTGLLKHGRSLQNVLRMIFSREYTETHNALQDARDELFLMKLLGQPLEIYGECKPKQNAPDRKLSPSYNRGSVSLSAYKYVIDELCGGSVRLLDCTTVAKTSCGNGTDGNSVVQYLSLQCTRCGYTWTQEADSFIKAHKCPTCGKTGKA